jgi:archaellum component FlaG (FlaF/FlaG flagellin family)
MVIAKAVAGFLNTEGGALLIGVNDDGDVVGLVDDFAVVKSPTATASSYGYGTSWAAPSG